MIRSLLWPRSATCWTVRLMFPVTVLVVLLGIPEAIRANGGQARQNVL